MRHYLAAAFAIGLISASTVVPGYAQAPRDCMVSGYLAPYGSNSEGSIDMSSGETCNLRLSTDGTIEASRISQAPKNGKLRMITSANAVYTPKAGFKGTDEFAFTIKGRSNISVGTSIVKIRATVR
jgi:hypothetical protein